MKQLIFISVLAVVIGTCFAVSAFAGDFYVIPVKNNTIEITSTIVPKTGQTDCWDSAGNPIDCLHTGQDGEYQMGNTGAVAPSESSPYPYTVPSWSDDRFTDNNDGTVTDNLTGLIWLKNANCFGARTWANALSDCNSLASGPCGLTDGSTAGDWRLPNFNELRSLDDTSQANPCLPADHPFTNVQTFDYWSSTTYSAPHRHGAWCMVFTYGSVGFIDKSSSYYVWPVRSGN